MPGSAPSAATRAFISYEEAGSPGAAPWRVETRVNAWRRLVTTAECVDTDQQIPTFNTEFTPKLATIFFSSSAPVHRPRLAQLRALHEASCCGAGCGARVPVITQTGPRVVSDTARSRRKMGAAFNGWTRTD